jgi:hypothetical protein
MFVDGTMGPMVLIIADPSMAEDEFKVEAVKGATHINDMMTKTRGCSAATNKHYWKETLLPHSQTKLPTLVEDPEDPMALFQRKLSTDGESRMLDGLCDAEVRKAFTASNVVLMKGAASCSETINADNFSAFFKGTKARALRQILSQVTQSHVAVQRRIEKATGKMHNDACK